MEIHEIRYFLALSETLNFTRAAERCNVTQPAMTRAIRGLEEELGGLLVHRERGNTHLTELGRTMKPYFAEMLGMMEEAKRRAQDFVRLKDTALRVGMMCTIGPTRLVDLFGAFARGFRGVELSVKDGAADALEEGLGRGELDIAIYCRAEGPSDGVHALPLYSERFIVALPPDDPLAKKRELSLADLDGRSYLARANCEYDSYIDRLCSQAGVSVKTVYRSDRDDWVQSMVAAGLGFTFIPEFAVSVPGLALRPLVDPAVIRHVGLMTVRGRPHGPAVGAFVHACRRYPWSEKLRQAAPARGIEAA